MLWFNHRKPASSRKPAAVLVPQRIDLPHTLTLGIPLLDACLPDTPLLDTPLLDTPALNLPGLHGGGNVNGNGNGNGNGNAVALPLEFTVRYSLPEYVVFMWQHARYLIRRRRIGAPASWTMLLRSTWLAGFHFVLQGRSRHTYGFTIDQHGIVRTGPGGVTLIGWEDVSAIRSYSRGRLLVLKRGTVPIPARCLNRQQSDSLAAYAAAFAASIRAAAAR